MPSASPLLVDALAFAARAHGTQVRKDGRTPYLVHPVGVLRLLSSRLGVSDPEVLAAAVLHDTLEDTPTTRDELGRAFGPRVLQWVEELTLPPDVHGASVPTSTKTRHLVAGLERISWPGVVIKLCDRWDNLSDSREAAWSETKRQEFYAQSEEMLDAVVRRRRRDPEPPGWTDPLDRALRGVRATLESVRHPA